MMNNQFHARLRAFSNLWLGALLLALCVSFFSATWVWSMPRRVELGGWTATAALPDGLALRNAVTHGDFLYVVGGKGINDNPLATIRGARIKPDGGLEPWAVMGQLPQALYLHAAVVAQDALYVMGGWDGSKTRTEVWRATFQANGMVGNWTVMPAYPLALDLHDAVYLNGRLYVVGGWNGQQAQTAIYQAPVTGSGLGAWQLAGDLPVPLYRLAVTGTGTNLYITGGYNTSGAANSVYRATANPDGTLGAWQSAPPLPVGLYYHKTLIHDGRVVVLGGRNDSAVFSEVRLAIINADGSLGAWQSGPALPAAIFRFGATTVTRHGSDYIYVVGGLRSETDYQREVYHSQVPVAPTATATATAIPTATPTPIQGLALRLANQPQDWAAPGTEVTYRITYANRYRSTFANVVVSDAVPNGAELVPGSIQGANGNFEASGTEAGAVITWNVGAVNPSGTGELSYRVRRPIVPTPVVPLALAIDLAGPTTAAPGAEVAYTFTVTNRSPVTLTNLIVTNTLPSGSVYVRGADAQPAADTVQWQLATLAPNSTAQVGYTVRATESLVNYDYRAQSSLGPAARGYTMIITLVNNQPPRKGDGFLLTNDGVSASWGVQGQGNSTRSNAVANPAYYQLYLPNVQR